MPPQLQTPSLPQIDYKQYKNYTLPRGVHDSILAELFINSCNILNGFPFKSLSLTFSMNYAFSYQKILTLCLYDWKTKLSVILEIRGAFRHSHKRSVQDFCISPIKDNFDYQFLQLPGQHFDCGTAHQKKVVHKRNIQTKFCSFLRNIFFDTR